MGNIYGLDKELQSFAASNDFAKLTNKVCYSLGGNLTAFSFYGCQQQQINNVLDFANMGGLLNESITLEQEIASYWGARLSAGGLMLPTNANKTMVIDYLLNLTICYIEYPKIVMRKGVETLTYEKLLATRNPRVLAAWMGCSDAEMIGRFSASLKLTNEHLIKGALPVVKLEQKAQGNTVKLLAKPLVIANASCIPLYMLHAYTEGLRGVLGQSLVKFTYVKDNGNLRHITTTINKGIIRSYYMNDNFVNMMMKGIDISTKSQGGMMVSSMIGRGYIKVPELGASKYDLSGVRSLNIARLISGEVVQTIDTTYIDVDLDNVRNLFCTYVQGLSLDDLRACYTALTSSDADSLLTSAEVTDLIFTYVAEQHTKYTTEYLRKLHKFMLIHQEWFGGYTGERV